MQESSHFLRAGRQLSQQAVFSCTDKIKWAEAKIRMGCKSRMCKTAASPRQANSASHFLLAKWQAGHKHSLGPETKRLVAGTSSEALQHKSVL